MTKPTVCIIHGSEVDPWLDGIDFQARITGESVVIKVAPQHAKKFKSYNQDMWLQWVRQYVKDTYNGDAAYEKRSVPQAPNE
jgi:hypothetical protein